ncbi:hypothetical protein BFP75_17715 [Maribacter sp. 4G9]|nr:hypothetical protein BFP75_17715 [Maribacter sp. 4G9]
MSETNPLYQKFKSRNRFRVDNLRKLKVYEFRRFLNIQIVKIINLKCEIAILDKYVDLIFS